MQMFKENDNIKPSQLLSHTITKAINESKSLEEVEELAEAFVDTTKTKKPLQKAKEQLIPHGHTFEAVAIHKQKTDQHDKYLMYAV